MYIYIYICIHSLSNKFVCVRLNGHTFLNLGSNKFRGYHSKAHGLGMHIDTYKVQFECEIVEKPHRRVALSFFFSQRALLATKATSVKTTGNDG